MAKNEKRQSAAERPETSTSHPQSTLDPLDTVNARLQSKLDRLEQVQSEVQDLLASGDIAAILLDPTLRIKLFTRPTARLLDLGPSDIGRPVGDFSATLADADLLADAHQVLESLVSVEKDVWSNADETQRRCYLRRILPYRSVDDHVGGVVVTYLDITERRRAERELEARVEERTRALDDREQRLQTILNSVPDAIVIIGRDGLIQSINPACESIFGYVGSELIGQNVSVLMPAPYREEHDGYIARYLQTGRPRIIGKRQELSGRRKDGTTFPLELTVNEVGQLGLFGAIIRDLSAMRVLQREVANASMREQQRLGREIHDGFGQQLTGLNILAVSLRNELAAAGLKNVETLEEMIGQLNSLIGETRKLSWGLVPFSVTTRGLVDALKKLADQVNDTMGVACRFVANRGAVEFGDLGDATQVYRIVQEAMNNALKYADADHITIKLDSRNGSVELTITDDGKGFDLPAMEESDGFGLRIMRYRASILGGQLFIDSAPGKGTRVRLQLPR